MDKYIVWGRHMPMERKSTFLEARERAKQIVSDSIECTYAQVFQERRGRMFIMGEVALDASGQAVWEYKQ